jgi:hypothetical protein
MAVSLEVSQAFSAVEEALCELDCFVQVLNAPDDAPPIAFVLSQMVGRLTNQFGELSRLVYGGMGGMPPMATNEVEGSDSCRGPSIGVPDS